MTLAALWDLRYRRIPNRLNVVTAVLGISTAALQSWTALGYAFAGAALLFVLLLGAYRMRWIGGGDVKLGTAIGAWLGPIHGVYALVLGVALGGVAAVVLLVRNGAAFRTEVKTNLHLAFYTGRIEDTEQRPDSAHIPLGTTLAVAAVAIALIVGGVHA